MYVFMHVRLASFCPAPSPAPNLSGTSQPPGVYCAFQAQLFMCPLPPRSALPLSDRPSASASPPPFASFFLTRTPTGELLRAHGMEESTGFYNATEPRLSSAHFTLDSFCILSYTNLFGAPSASTSDSDQRRQRERATSAVRFDDWIKQATVDDGHPGRGRMRGACPAHNLGAALGGLALCGGCQNPFT